MATLAQLNEKLGASRRAFAAAVESQAAVYAAVDTLETQITALTADSPELAGLQSQLDAKAKESREAGLAVNRLRTELDDLDAKIRERETFEANQALANAPQQRQAPITAGDQVRVNVAEPSKEQLSLDIGYLIQAQYLSYKDRVPLRAVLGGEQGYAEFRNDRLLAATTSNNAIVPTNYARTLIDILRAKTVVDKMTGVKRIPLPNGNLTLPRQATTSTAYWTAEGANVTPSDVTSDTITLSAKKLFTQVPVSGELMRRSDPSIAEMLRNDLVRTAARAIDLAFLRNATAGTPLGLKYLVDNYSSAAQRVNATAIASATVATVTADLGKLQLMLANSNVPDENRYWVFTPRTEQYLMDLRDGNGSYVFPEMQRGMLKGSPYLTTTQIPNNLTVTISTSRTDCSEIYYVEASELLIGETPTMSLDVSSEAAYWDGTAVQSAFSRDMAVSRLIMERDFNIMHLQSVAYMQGVDWGK